MKPVLKQSGLFVLFMLLIGCLFVVSCGSQVQAAHIVSPTNKATQQCGTIAVNPAGKLIEPHDAMQRGTCFALSYQHCRAAELTFSKGGIDTVAKHTFKVLAKTVREKGVCQMTDLVQQRVVPMPFRTLGTYRCTALKRTDKALLVQDCGVEGTVIVPLQNS